MYTVVQCTVLVVNSTGATSLGIPLWAIVANYLWACLSDEDAVYLIENVVGGLHIYCIIPRFCIP